MKETKNRLDQATSSVPPAYTVIYIIKISIYSDVLHAIPGKDQHTHSSCYSKTTSQL